MECDAGISVRTQENRIPWSIFEFPSIDVFWTFWFEGLGTKLITT